MATEQAPQSPSAHPSFDPVRPEARSQSSKVVFGDTSTSRIASPLRLNSKDVFMFGECKLLF
jgi:hypothetical protein